MKTLALLFLLPFAASLPTHSSDDIVAGSLVESHYENRLYSFSLDIPEGWRVASAHLQQQTLESVGKNDVLFLALERVPGPNIPETTITVRGEKFAGTPGVSVEKVKGYSESLARSINSRLIQAPVRVVIGGIDMYRSDLKVERDGQPHFFSVLAVGIRDRILVFQIHSLSQQGLDDAVRALMSATEFIPDFTVRNSDLDMSKPAVTVSEAVMNAFVQRKVLPRYPEEARKSHVGGIVVMNAEISREGRVQRLWVVDENEELTVPTKEAGRWNMLFTMAAVEAVQQWAFKPYLLNGKPVRVSTHISMNFRP